MSATGSVEELGALSARARALALLRIRSRATAVAILPAAAAVVLFVAEAQGRLGGGAWDTARWAVTACAAVVLLLAATVSVAVARARPAISPTVPLTEKAAPDLYRLVRDLADRLDVPAPSAIALTPDCDSWLEDRTHPAARPRATEPAGGLAGGRRGRRVPAAPVLVIGSPFLWWMRVAELRAVLAPVVAGTGPSAHPDIAAARRFVRGLDAVVADASVPGQGFLRRIPSAFAGSVARVLLRGCRGHAAEMERCVAAAASVRAQGVDYGLRIVAQEQVGLAYAGWDRLLTRVALPAWRMGRWPSRLDAGVVSALTELSRRDRLADGFASRLGERPACDLLEEPGAADEAASLLAARLFHGGPAETGPGWSPVDWQQYPEEVVDRKWRTEAARLHRVLDTMGVATNISVGAQGQGGAPTDGSAVPTLSRVIDHLAAPGGNSEELAAGIGAAVARDEAGTAARPGAGAEEARSGPEGGSAAAVAADPLDVWGPVPLPLFPLQPPRTGTELLADHVVAMVCCAAVDTAGAAPGLDWLDGPALLVDGGRRSDLGAPVLVLVEDGDAEPLRAWLSTVGVRADKPVRLV
ncbi:MULTISPECIES: M48 family metalloprotease [Streptomyces]|uniref:Integral membrane protein n=1 Tax=Streptomyces clavifer TaxID=68188 RepID=A0ABS4V894_9ACTN|nr:MULTISPECIES: hypothetical protein [Streptomyces]MBP2360132.1 hypothetical protein [Streptomyces clavifer]MDX2743292.1 hypothetical protein [Streptomyces sp. NRRL_B-2557]GHA96882.1 hypothetical protein GCM10010392_24190 [Streptomyces clavifer]